jgi:hypothetical protein
MAASLKKNGIFIAIIIIVVVVAYLWYANLSPSGDEMVDTVGTGAIASGVPTPSYEPGKEPRNYILVRSQILETVDILENDIHLDTTILDSPAFIALQTVNRGQPPAVQIGKRNPFQPFQGTKQ